ncbi:MAG: HAD family hydrolase [Bacillota bacterium]
MIKAVLFDLDGTLLPVDTGKFAAEYLKEVVKAVSPLVEPARFKEALLASTGVVLKSCNPSMTNEEVFWQDFRARLGDIADELAPVLDKFYNQRFSVLARLTNPSQHARAAVQAALDRGLRVAVATQPVFPRVAVLERLSWAGVRDLPWELVTCYEEMHCCKPNPYFFAEIAGQLNLQPEQCLMVGNDVEEDLTAEETGMRTCLVTDYLINKNEVEVSTEWSGTLSELAGWLAVAKF